MKTSRNPSLCALPQEPSGSAGCPLYTSGVFFMNKKTEIWKPIEGFEGLYEISNYGRVKSLERKTYHNKGYRQVNERILKGGLNADGYRMVILRKNNKVHDFLFG